uniref:DM2 domain-containing protein n=1 Tax=Junco hyemalis TaxID=40217 RepID=A0A8C5IC36_JUNHY
SVLEQLLTARMSFPNSSRIPLGQANQPPKPQALIPSPCCPQVMHFLGQYIMARQLYDQRQQHLVHCGGDQLGELLGLQSFSVKDPSSEGAKKMKILIQVKDGISGLKFGVFGQHSNNSGTQREDTNSDFLEFFFFSEKFFREVYFSWNLGFSWIFVVYFWYLPGESKICGNGSKTYLGGERGSGSSSASHTRGWGRQKSL